MVVRERLQRGCRAFSAIESAAQKRLRARALRQTADCHARNAVAISQHLVQPQVAKSQLSTTGKSDVRRRNRYEFWNSIGARNAVLRHTHDELSNRQAAPRMARRVAVAGSIGVRGGVFPTCAADVREEFFSGFLLRNIWRSPTTEYNSSRSVAEHFSYQARDNSTEHLA